MPRVDRRRFEASFAHRQVRVDRLPRNLVRSLEAHGVSRADLERIAGDDHVIQGAEFNQLYEALATRTQGGQRVDTRVSEELFAQLTARAERSPSSTPEPTPTATARSTGIGGRRSARPGSAADETPPGANGVGANGAAANGVGTNGTPAVAQPADPGAPAAAQPETAAPEGPPPLAEGYNRRERRIGREDVVTHAVLDPETQRTAAALAALPPATEGRHTPVRAFLDAIEARDERARLLAEGDRRGAGAVTRPEGVPADIWNVTAALDRRGISSTDVQFYLAHGTLPDLLNEDGSVAMRGADRLAELENAAIRRGSWTAVNTFTFLVRMRRSSMAAEREAAGRVLATIPESDPRHAQITAGIEQSRQLDTQLGRSLQSMYRAATGARESTGRGLIGRADDLSRQAREARSGGDEARAVELEQRAQGLRDRGAQITHAEAEYRSSMRSYRADAGRLYRLSAAAQISTGEEQVRALATQTGPLPEAPPAVLGNDDGTNTGNGVPGAERLLTTARAVDPTAGTDDTQLALEGRRAAAVGGFHRAHLDRGGYFDRVDPETGEVSTRSSGLARHRDLYLGARVDQANAATGRLALARAEEPSTDRDLRISSLEAERRGVAEELSRDLGQSLASDRAATDARARVRDLDAAVTSADEQRDGARTAARDADSGVDNAESNAYALLGDTLKTDGEARRDREGVSDARTVRSIERGRRDLAVVNARETRETRDRAVDAERVATTQAQRDREDAARVLRAAQRLETGEISATVPTTTEEGYRFARGMADRSARAETSALDRAALSIPESAPADHRDRLTVASRRVDLSRYWTRSAEGEAVALGDAGRSGATGRLDRASRLISQSDATRLTLDGGSDARLGLASGLVTARAELATAEGDYRPDVARQQLLVAETTVDGDLALDRDRAGRAYGEIGVAATAALARSESRFDAILDSGNHVPGAADALYLQAHRMFDPVPFVVMPRGIPDTPATRSARETLGRFDAALDQVDGMFTASQAQIRNGADYALARTRGLGHSEIGAAQAQVSTVISGGAWVLSLGFFDMKEEMADAGEHMIRHRMSWVRQERDRLVRGADHMRASYAAARTDGRAFEWLHSVRIISDRSRADTMPQTYGRAFVTIAEHIPDDMRSRMDWQTFNRIAIREGHVPVAAALSGSVLGFEQAMENLSDDRIMAVTPGMADAIQSQADSLEETTDGMMWIIGINTALEVGLGIVLTGGIGSVGAAAEGANALNTTRTAASAMSAARNAQLALRAMAALRTMGTVTVVGGGMMAANYGVGKLVGRNTGAARGFEVLTNFIPIGAGQRAAGIVGHADDVAAAGTRLQQLRRAMSWSHVRSASAWSRALTPVALGSAQAFGTTVATPWIAQRVGLERSDLGQAAIGLGLNVIFAGGMAAAVRPRTTATGLADHLSAAMGEHAPSRRARGQMRTEIETFLRNTEGRVPTDAEVSALKTRLQEHMGLDAATPDAPERVAIVDGAVEALRIERATQLHAGAFDDGTTPAQARDAVIAAGDALYQARGGDAGGTSRLQAYRDAAMTMSERLGGQARAAFEAGDTARGTALMELRQVVGERALAAELVEGTARGNPNDATLSNPTNRANAERILAEELTAARTALDGTEGPGLGQRDGSSFYDGLVRRLREEGGLSSEAAETVVRGARDELVHQAVLRHLAAAQVEAGPRPLRNNEISRIATELAQRAGLPDAPAYARSIVEQRPALERSGFVRPSSRPTLDAAMIEQRARAAADADPSIARFIEQHGPIAERLVGELGAERFMQAFGDGDMVSFEARRLIELPPERINELIDVAQDDPARVQGIMQALGVGESRSVVLRALNEVGVEPAARLAEIGAQSPRGLGYLAAREGGATRVLQRLATEPNALAAQARRMEARIFMRANDGTYLVRGDPPAPIPAPTRRQLEGLARRAGVDPAVLRDPTAHPAEMARVMDQMRSEMPADMRAALDRELAGRRFIDEVHYQEAFDAGVNNPEHRYGRVDFEAWQRAESIMMGAADRGEPLTADTLIAAHRAASEGILPEPRRGLIRSAPAETAFQGGDGPMGQRVVTQAEFETMRANPHLNVHDLGASDGGRLVIVEYTSPAEVRAKLDVALRRIDERLAAGEDPVTVAADAQREFVSIHPFLDGNGRMSRLVMDYVLRREGLSPSVVRDPNLDTQVSSAAWRAEVRRGMQRPFEATMNAWNRAQRGRPPPIRANADPVGPSPVGDSAHARRDTLGWTGQPTATPPAGAEHLGVIHRGMQAMSPRSRRLIESYLQRAESGPPELVARRDALATRQQQIWQEHGRLLGTPADQLPAPDRARQEALQTELATISSERTTVDRAIGDAQLAARRMAIAEMQRVRDGMRRHVSDAESRRIADGMPIHPSAAAAAEPARLRAWVADALQLIPHEIGAESISLVSDRPRADARRSGTLNIGEDITRGITFHEIGHYIEFTNPEVAAAARAWVMERSRMANGGTAQRGEMRDLAGSDFYDRGEMAFEDHFDNPYIGRDYGEGGSTEVVSVGMEYLTSPERMLQLYQRDPEHFFFMMGVLEP
ncbi:MAG: Fic family protein [Deltaproteobacteria bacterium]|jgi:prophage maintenance system killer protein